MREAGEIIAELRADNGAYIDEITRLKAELAEAKETLVNHAQIQNILLGELTTANAKLSKKDEQVRVLRRVLRNIQRVSPNENTFRDLQIMAREALAQTGGVEGE